MSEMWRPIAGYEGLYEVSSLGRVKSLARTNSVGRRLRERILRQAVASHGYPSVALHRDGQRSYTVHALVATAFLGSPPDGVEICHVDGDRLNPAAANLRYDTRSSNNLDQVIHGTHPHAFKTHCPQRHAYTPENTYTYRGRRTCRTCASESKRRSAARKKAAA